MTMDVILLSFLQSQKDSSPDFQLAVKNLQHTFDKDGYLEADGGISIPKYALESSGFVPDGGPHIDEELCRSIGAQLAELGDRFEREGVIKQEVVESLVNQVLNHNMTEDSFSKAVQSMLKNVPSGMEQEKACAVVAMTLATKVGKTVPNLLLDCYTTAVSYMQRNCNIHLITRPS